MWRAWPRRSSPCASAAPPPSASPRPSGSPPGPGAPAAPGAWPPRSRPRPGACAAPARPRSTCSAPSTTWRRPSEGAEGLTDDDVYRRLVAAARGLQAADADLCRRIGEHGAALLEDGFTVLTHCNTGALATAGWGTALGVVYAAAEAGKRIHVYAGETRPLLQGARLTSWELHRRGIEVTVICDGAAAAVLRDRGVDCVITGSDRIAANGDVANKIGTYGLALMARASGIPLYVAAPTTTLDLELASGGLIPIEERPPGEITNGFGRATVPAGVAVYNPAFDVTPHDLVSAIITEHGIARPPYAGRLPGQGSGA